MAKVAPTKKGATKSKVRFAPLDKIASVTNRHILANYDDVAQAWYQPQEYVHIKLDILSFVGSVR